MTRHSRHAAALLFLMCLVTVLIALPPEAGAQSGATRESGLRYYTIDRTTFIPDPPVDPMLVVHDPFIQAADRNEAIARKALTKPYSPGAKLVRGLDNLFLGWVEIPKEVARESRRNNVAYGLTRGVGKGCWESIKRAGYGIGQICTFYLSHNPEPSPLVEKEDSTLQE